MLDIKCNDTISFIKDGMVKRGKVKRIRIEVETVEGRSLTSPSFVIVTADKLGYADDDVEMVYGE